MEANQKDSPVVEAERAETEMYGYIDSRQSFIMEAGAGAGKTYSLKKALSHTLNNHKRVLSERDQQIACITFTEAATRELANEVDNHPLVTVRTIHSFCWGILKDFQPTLYELIPKIDKWKKYLDDEHHIKDQQVVYDVGYRMINEDKISLHHDDIPLLISMLFDNEKFQKLFVSQYPILYIDEYQDTHADLMRAIVNKLMDGTNVQVGLFGDSWQMIYDGVCGSVSDPKFKLIKKHANFRSDKKIVDVLNMMRPELKQIPSNNNPKESRVAVYTTDTWQGERGSGAHKDGSLPDDIAHDYYDKLRKKLEGDGWDFFNKDTKVLMLTNNILAKEQGYSDLLEQFPFPYTDQLMNADHRYIKLFVEKIEPVARSFEQKKYGEIFTVLGKRSKIKNHTDKAKWSKYMAELIDLRNSGTVGDVVDYIISHHKNRIGVSDGFIKSEELLQAYVENPKLTDDEDIKKRYQRFIDLRKIPYSQVIAFDKYLNEQTPFSTNHKVKGLQYERVLVVVSQSWNKYNFRKMLEWGHEADVPAGKEGFFIQNRNLFYVVCSRSKKQLVLLFVRELGDRAMGTLSDWFGDSVIEEL